MSLSDEKEEWELLLRSPAWVKLDEMLKGQIAGRVNQVVLTPLAGADAVYEQEFMKGEIAALKLVGQMPALEIERLTADIQAVQNKEIENE